jgi:hypothetical protein
VLALGELYQACEAQIRLQALGKAELKPQRIEG